MKKVTFLLLILFFTSTDVFAKYTQTCVVNYMTQNGWSKNYTVDVSFMTGTELNEATNSYNYSSYSTYAIIFWGEDKASVIKLSSYTACALEVDKNCITNTYSALKGQDQDGDDWKICVSNYCY